MEVRSIASTPRAAMDEAQRSPAFRQRKIIDRLLGTIAVSEALRRSLLSPELPACFFAPLEMSPEVRHGVPGIVLVFNAFRGQAAPIAHITLAPSDH
jgi:hypothetical protein